MDYEPGELTPETENQPTIQEIIDAARDFLSEEDIAELTTDYDEVWSDVVTILDSQGVDWEELFRQKGLM
jgi:hypothetical protein